MNNQPVLSFAGAWRYVSSPGADIVNFYSQVALGQNKLNGLVFGGWAIAGWDNQTFMPTTIAIFEQNPEGGLTLNTGRYVQDPTINGAGSVIVSDFNKDGTDDILLPAYGESPFLLKPSTALLSTADGRYQKITLNDTTNAHSASLGWLNGKETIVTAGYLSVDTLFQFNAVTNQFDVTQWGNDWVYEGNNVKSFYASAALVADFDNDGQSELVLGDDTFAGNNTFDPDGRKFLTVYQLNGNKPESTPIFKTWLAANPDPKYQEYLGSINGWEHTYRVWADDFNHDQMLDILAGVGPWSAEVLQSGSKLVMMQNVGDLAFEDSTAKLAGAYSASTTNVDYSMQILDIDQSGINSYLLGDTVNENYQQNCNYLLLNDGTGKLHTALHDEFLVWGERVKNYLDAREASYNNHFVTPRFAAYQTADGSISYLANWVAGNDGTINFVNVPVAYNVGTDFTEDITVADRNNSMLMRTWAGDDTFYDTNANTTASIDGGLGLDEAVYSGRQTQYLLTGLANGRFDVVKKLNQTVALHDSLSNIERLQFADTMVGLDTGKGEVSGEAYRIYKAAFDRTPDSGGLGFWIDALDSGADLVNVAQGFIDSAEFKAMYGENASNEHFVTLLYNHVLHRAPEGEGYQFWLNSLSVGATRAQVLKDFSESAENIDQTAALVANGVSYQEWVG